MFKSGIKLRLRNYVPECLEFYSNLQIHFLLCAIFDEVDE